MKIKYILLSILSILILSILFCISTVTAHASTSWTIAVYMCGSDLESNVAAATADLQEMINGMTSDSNVNLIVQTGGANTWHTNGISSQVITRFVINDKGLHHIITLPDANMGNPATLADFLKFTATVYPADRNMLILWNHGGGAEPGICLDERYKELISLTGLRNAISSVHNPNTDKPFFEIVGMDACLMGTVETAYALNGFAKYLIASEEWEPGGGWMYSPWLFSLTQNPDMITEQIGQVIIDSYMSDCAANDVAALATQSMIDISKTQNVIININNILAPYIAKDPAVACRNAFAAENYGGNTFSQGYANMIDIVDFAKKMLPADSQDLKTIVDSVNDAVLISMKGQMRNNGHGLSMYFPLDGRMDVYQRYIYRARNMAPSELVNAYRPIVFNNNIMRSSNNLQFPDPILTVQNGKAVSNVDANLLQHIRSVKMAFVYPDTRAGVMIHLGNTVQINVDYINGTITDALHGTWPVINGKPLYIDVVSVDGDTALLSAPVYVNDQRKALLLSEDLNTGKLEIIGLRTPKHASGAVDRGLTQLKPGDNITLVYRAALLNDTKDFVEVSTNKFTISDVQNCISNTVFGDGVYAVCLELEDMNGKIHRSNIVKYTVVNGKIQAERVL